MKDRAGCAAHCHASSSMSRTMLSGKKSPADVSSSPLHRVINPKPVVFVAGATTIPFSSIRISDARFALDARKLAGARGRILLGKFNKFYKHPPGGACGLVGAATLPLWICLNYRRPIARPPESLGSGLLPRQRSPEIAFTVLKNRRVTDAFGPVGATLIIAKKLRDFRKPTMRSADAIRFFFFQ